LIESFFSEMKRTGYTVAARSEAILLNEAALETRAWSVVSFGGEVSNRRRDLKMPSVVFETGGDLSDQQARLGQQRQLRPRPRTIMRRRP
jgi:hypothetical protein